MRGLFENGDGKMIDLEIPAFLRIPQEVRRESWRGRCCRVMRDLFRLIGWAVVDLFRSRAALEAEIWTLRQQINVLRRTAPKRLSFSVFDHFVFVGLYRLFPRICDARAMAGPGLCAA